MANAPTPAAPAAPKLNRLGLAVVDYRGLKTTLCAGCGHNAISERILEAMFELGVQPERVAKFSGIGCSSKTPAYFMNRSHSFNAVHGRMPSVATGALLANRSLLGVGVSGDGDTASIGIGQFVHLMRRNLSIVYIVENNGVYGLTKGQVSATADVGAKLKTGAVNELQAIDTCALAIQLGATFVARSFSGDKRQLSAILKAAVAHRGTAMLDVISPCVTFNDHEGSTKSVAYVKEHDAPLQELEFIPAFQDIAVEYDPGTTVQVTMHDGSHLRLRKLEEGYDPRDRIRAVNRLMAAAAKNEVLTGVLYLDPGAPSFVELLGMVDAPLATLPQERVRPPRPVLDEVMESLR
jgi:2-oxoglutarate ferredoxin oxidoreductase subunit beta